MLSNMATPHYQAIAGDTIDLPLPIAKDLVEKGFAEEVDSLGAGVKRSTPPAKDGDGSKEGAEESNKKTGK